MIMAGIIWLLGKMGVAATPEQFEAYRRAFHERGHHLMVDFGGTRLHGTRWGSGEFSKAHTIGLGYEYLVDRKYNGVGLEVLGQVIGPWFHSGSHEYLTGAGLAYYPISPLRLNMAAGADILDTGKTEAFGRVGIGFRIPFFSLAVQPHGYVQANTAGVFTWLFGARFEY